MAKKKKTSKKLQSTDYRKLTYRPKKSRKKPQAADVAPNWKIVARNYLWMVETLKWRHDNTGLNKGTYSPELTEAMGEVESLEKWEQQNV